MPRTHLLSHSVLVLAALALVAASPATQPIQHALRNAPEVTGFEQPVLAARADSLGIRDLLDIATTTVADLSADGRWLALTITTRRDQLGAEAARDGDPSYLRAILTRLIVVDTKSLAQRAVFPTKKSVRGATWNPDGSKLAMIVLENDAQSVTVWDRASGKLSSAKLPATHYVAENSELRWSDDGAALVFAARQVGWKAKATQRFNELTKGPVTVLDGTEDFLEWDAMNRLNEDRSIVQWHVAANTVTQLHADALLGAWTLAKDGSAITTQQDITKKTDYDIIGGRDWKLVARTFAGDAPTSTNSIASRPVKSERTILATLKGAQLAWADDGQRFAITRDGRVAIGSITDTATKQILGPATASRVGGNSAASPAATSGAPVTSAPDSSAAARALRAKERFSVNRWSPAGDALLATNSEGFWVVDAASGNKELIVTTPDSSDANTPRPTLVAWSNDGRYLYFAENARTEWNRSLVRYDRTTKQKQSLVHGNKFYTNLRLSKDGATAILNVGDGNHIADVYVADATLGNMRRVHESNPQLAAKPIAKTELIHYLDADGKTRYGVLHYPTDYEKGKKYPTIMLVYEDFFDDAWDAFANILASHGYAVVKPSVGFEIGYPGEAWVKGVTAAANEVIRMGVADSSRMGVQGTSYGGYATNLLVTQTDRFKAAINMSGKVDFISFYTDSPRLGVRNIHAAEKSQDRIGATMWQQPQKYVQHSAIMFADRIKTPLLLMTGGEDHNVPAINTREMYYALRRLGKTVTWANYANGGHGVPNTTESDFMDYHQRMLDWYAKYLAAPKKNPNAASHGEQH